MTSTDRPEIAVGAVALDDDRLLLVRRGHGPAAGTWSIPGGRVELQESIYEAVVRETAEETGLTVAVDRFLGWSERLDPADDLHVVILDFAVTALDPAQPLRAGDDAAEAAWVAIAELSAYRISPGLIDFLEDTGILG